MRPKDLFLKSVQRQRAEEQAADDRELARYLPYFREDTRCTLLNLRKKYPFAWLWEYVEDDPEYAEEHPEEQGFRIEAFCEASVAGQPFMMRGIFACIPEAEMQTYVEGIQGESAHDVEVPDYDLDPAKPDDLQKLVARAAERARDYARMLQDIPARVAADAASWKRFEAAMAARGHANPKR